jgi:methionine-rich copper-binding protein CopC
MKRILLTLVLSLAVATLPTFAQMGGMGGSMPGSDAIMAKLFGKNKSFTSDAEISVKDSKQKTMTMTMTMSMSDGKMRNEMDMLSMKGGQIPPAAITQMKTMGMDKMVIIELPDKKMNYMIYPNLHAYAEMPLNGDSLPDGKDFKMDKTSLGKDTVDGHACDKSKVVITDAKGVTHDVTVWNATDLKDFPIKMEMTENGSDIQINYKNVKLVKPDSALFEPPSDMTKYDSMQKMMQTEMKKKMGGGAPGGPGRP